MSSVGSVSGSRSGKSGRSSRLARSRGFPTASFSERIHGRRDAAGEAAFAAPRNAARADGHGRLPSASRRSSRRRGCLSGRVPGAGAQGRVDPRSRSAGKLALSGSPSHGPARPKAEALPTGAQQRRGQRHARFTLACQVRSSRWSNQPAEPADRPRAGRGPVREIDRLPRPFRLPVVLRYFEGLTLEEAAAPAPLPGWHRAEPPGAGV